MLKKILFLLCVGLSLSSVRAMGADVPLPTLLVSDITSGPAAGGKDDQGAIVTVTGRNFGAQQNSGYVTTGGVKAAVAKACSNGFLKRWRARSTLWM